MLEEDLFDLALAAGEKKDLAETIAANPRLIIIDLSMTDMSGMEVCRRLFASGIQAPFIALPSGGLAASSWTALHPDRILSFSGVEIDVDRRRVKRLGNEVKLTRVEFDLLMFFLQNADRVLTRDVLLNSVWGYEFPPKTRTVDAHVQHLRQKLEARPDTPRHFVTIHGVGYRFNPDVLQ